MKIFHHEQISHEMSNGEFFPNYGILGTEYASLWVTELSFR